MPEFQTLSYDYLGGAQTAKPLTKYANEDALISIGGHFNKRGGYEKRRGGVKYNSISVGQAGRGIFDFRFNNNTAQKLLLFGQNTIWEGNGGNPLAAPLLAGLPDARWSAVKFNIGGKDFVFADNGLTDMRKYDGNTFTRASLAVPANTMVGASAAGGGSLVPGVYQLAVTFLTADDEESNPADTITVTVAPGDDKINLTVIPISANPEVTKRRIYMSAVGGAILFGNQDINDNVTVATSIIIDSTGLELEYDHDEAPQVQFLKPFGNRLAGAGDPNDPGVLYLSKEFETWYWPRGIGSAKDYRYKVGNGDPITGICDFFDNLLVSTDSDLFLVSGAPEDGSLVITKVQSNDRCGTLSHWSMKVIEGWCWYVGRNSVYRSNGFEIQDVGWSLSSYFSPGTGDSRFKINPNFLKNCVAIDDKSKPNNHYKFSCATGTDTLNNMTFMIDFATLKFDAESNRIRCDHSTWPGFYNEASGIVVSSAIDKWYRWDDLGFIFIEDSIEGDGAQVTSISTGLNIANTLNDTTQAWTINAFVGLYVTQIPTTVGAGIGSEERHRIISNTGTQIVLGTNWAIIPPAGAKYAIGGIEYDYAHKWDNYGQNNLSKRWRYCRPRFETDGTFDIQLIYAFDFLLDDPSIETLQLKSKSLWDVGLWDVAYWDIAAVIDDAFPIIGDRIHRWSLFRVRNLGAGEHFLFSGYDKMYQLKGKRH